MINFIKKIVENKVDEETHGMFTRYGLGEFEKEEFKIKVGSSNIKIWAGFEYTNTLFKFLASQTNDSIKAKGLIEVIGDKDISDILDKHKIEYEKISKRGMRGMKKFQFQMDFEETGDKLLKLAEDLSHCHLFIDLKAGKRDFKVKKKSLPKIGKETEKFCSTTLEKGDIDKVVEEFLFDTKVDSFKEAIIKHIYNIKNIDLDEKLLKEDPLKARLEAKREGVLIREIEVDGNKETKEYKFKV